MSCSSSQSKTPIQIFHHKVVTQLTLHLKKYRNSNPTTNNLFQSFNTQSEPSQQLSQFTTQQISQFLYDILQLQNSSIEFIMREIFESDKRSTWHLEEILKTVLDVQFVITVNNSIVAGIESTNNSKTKQNEVSFIKIEPNELVELIYDNCFFLENSTNAISKHLIQQIVHDINMQNGNKGHILLVEYKAYMIKNVIEKHNVRKFFTPNNRPKPLTPINKDKLLENSQSIKEVDQESEIMAWSKRNVSTLSNRENQIRLDQHSKIKESELKELVKENLQALNEVSVFEKVQREVWKSIKDSIPNIDDITQEQFLKQVKELTSKKLTPWPEKYTLHLHNKLNKLSTSTLSKNQQICTIIRLIGEQGFKIYHDQINSHQSFITPLPNAYFMNQKQLTQILLNTFQKFLDQIDAKKTLQNLAIFLVEEKGQRREGCYYNKKWISFRDYLSFIREISHIPSIEN